VRIALGYRANPGLFNQAEREIGEIAKMDLTNDLYLQLVTGAGTANIPAFPASFWIIGFLDRLVWTRLI